MRIRRKFKGRSLPKYQTGGGTCPDGYVKDASGNCVPNILDTMFPGANEPDVTQTEGFKAAALKGFPNNQTRLGQIEEDADTMALGNDIAGMDNFAKQLAQEQASISKDKDNFLDSEFKNQYEQDFTKEETPITTKPDSQIFNPYAGVDIPTAAYLFGENIGKDGDATTAVASGLKLITGLGRNITSGIGNAKRNSFQMQELREKQRESKLDEPIALEDGGKFGEDIKALFDKVQFPVMANGGGTDPKPGENRRELTAEERAALKSQFSEEESLFTENTVGYDPWGTGGIFEAQTTPTAPTHNLDLGKYKDVNYFDVQVDDEGYHTLYNTKKNPANPDLYKEQLEIIQKLNPSAKIQRNNLSGFRPLSSMEDGGTANRKLTGNVVSGTSIGTENVELEDGEFLEEPGGTPKLVEGKTHEEGGEEMDLPGGTEVLSDNLTLNKTQAKVLDEKYGIKVGVKDTYAKALDKYNKKIGLTDLIKEEEEIIEEVRKQKENAAEEGADTPTININLEFLSSKLNELTDRKGALEEQSSIAFSEMFELQESTKPKKERAEAQEEFKIGGKVYSRDQIIGISKSFDIDEEKAINIIKKMAEGGSTDEDDPGKKVTKSEADTNVKKGIWEDLGGGRYRKKGVPGIEGIVLAIEEAAGTEGTISDRTAPGAISGGKAAEAWDTKMTEYLNSGISYEELASKGHGTVEGLKKRFPNEYKPQSKESGEVSTIVIEQPYKIEGTPDEYFYVTEEGKVEPTKQVDVIKKTNEEKERGNFNALLLPENMPLFPQGLQLPTKITRTYGRLDAERLSPDQRLAELNRGVDAAMAQLDRLPSGQKEAAVLQLQANKQAQSDKIIQETNAANNQVAQYEDVFNIRQGDRQEDARAIDALDYERRAFGALANTEDDFRRFFNTVQERNIQNFNTINSLNLLNQVSENFDFGNNGVEFTGGVDMSAEDFLKKTKFNQAVGISNSSKQTTTKKKTAKKGGRIKR